jgi:hypothetical protein
MKQGQTEEINHEQQRQVQVTKHCQ